MTIKDPGRTLALLNIVEKVTTVAPGMTYLISEAMAELHALHENIRKTHEKEQGQPITPAPVGDPESPAQSPPPGMEDSPDFATHPTASKPTEEPVDAKTPVPPVSRRS